MKEAKSPFALTFVILPGATSGEKPAGGFAISESIDFAASAGCVASPAAAEASAAAP